MKVKDVEPMVDRCPSSEHYGKPFGVVLTYSGGFKKRFSDFGLALCESLTRSQREFIKRVQKEIEGQK